MKGACPGQDGPFPAGNPVQGEPAVLVRKSGGKISKRGKSSPPGREEDRTWGFPVRPGRKEYPGGFEGEGGFQVKRAFKIPEDRHPCPGHGVSLGLEDPAPELPEGREAEVPRAGDLVFPQIHLQEKGSKGGGAFLDRE